VGENWHRITNCYSTAAVSGRDRVGGLVGLNVGRNWANRICSISCCYSTGTVRADSHVGGLVGRNSDGLASPSSKEEEDTVEARTTKSFWDVEASGQPGSAGGRGLSTAEMQAMDTFVHEGWDFADEIHNGTCDYWKISPSDYPRLRWPVMPQGLGTAENPYLIRDARDLGTVWYDPTAHYRLEASVDLSGITWSMAVVPWFEGTFDGNGHVISNLRICGYSYLGLFGLLGSGAIIQNLGLETVDVNGVGNNIGGVAGKNYGSITTSCSTGVVTGDSGVGGLVGFNYGNITCGGTDLGTIAASCSTAVVSGSSDVGGLIGTNWGFAAHCYAKGNVTGVSGVGGLVGDNSYCEGEEEGFLGEVHSLHDCYSVGAVSGEKYVGGLVGRSWEAGCTQCFWDTETSFQETSGGDVWGRVEEGLTTAEMQDPRLTPGIWAQPEGGGYPVLWWQVPSDVGLPVFSGGTGEPNDPYLISTADELNSIGNNPRLMKCHFRLVADLDLAGLAFHPIGTEYAIAYEGVFDGNEHTISHMSIDHEVTSVGYREPDVQVYGMFGTLASGGLVKNLGLVDANVAAYDTAGGLVAYNQGCVTECYVTGTVRGGWRGVGGLVGWNEGAVTLCYSDGAVVSSYEVGGLVGRNEGTIAMSDSTTTVTGGDRVGGLVGVNYGGITASNNTGAVTGGAGATGGLVGWNEGGVDMSYSTGAITGRHQDVGGLAGGNVGSIASSYSTGTVAGRFNVGGLVGTNGSWYTQQGGSVSNCYSTGAVTGTDREAGGLVGCNESNGSIRISYSTGPVSGATEVGGLVGINAGTVTNCYAAGSTTGGDKVGGLVGQNGYSSTYWNRFDRGTIEHCYSTGVVSSNGDLTGGLVGFHELGEIIFSFWDIETSDQATSDGGTGLTTGEMQTASTFLAAGWDFIDETENGMDDIWWILEGQDYPRLWWEEQPTRLQSSW